MDWSLPSSADEQQTNQDVQPTRPGRKGSRDEGREGGKRGRGGRPQTSHLLPYSPGASRAWEPRSSPPSTPPASSSADQSLQHGPETCSSWPRSPTGFTLPHCCCSGFSFLYSGPNFLSVLSNHSPFPFPPKLN